MHMLDPLFWAIYKRHTLPSERPDGARDAVEAKISQAIADGIAQTKLQASPHVVLLDHKFYTTTLKPLWAHWHCCGWSGTTLSLLPHTRAQKSCVEQC